MPQITLSRTQVASLVAFCDAAGSNEFFIAKDRGAYIGYSTGATTPYKQCLFYFKGCDPKKDKDFYGNTLRGFGGDDFGAQLPLIDMRKALDNPTIRNVRFTVTPESIRMETLS
ncbi:DUF3085 domain-containing protein (plasmid) [Cupriavidus sp. H19C3]|uniref:DUF3085 domain-containing protein n=1 Tax=Cupriavidus sp. H19C3 TaxID=3241603 RepID=UPI003BF821B5